MYTTKKISVVIPTYNRPKDVSQTLKSLVPLASLLCEIIIVDQSKNEDTKSPNRLKIKISRLDRFDEIILQSFCCCLNLRFFSLFKFCLKI